MSTIRVKKDGHYFAASNIPFNDERLSWEARGIMGYLLSKPDNWTISVVDLIRKSPAGKFVVKRVLKELEKFGYVQRERHKDIEGRFYWVSTINEKPIDQFTVDGSTVDGKPVDIISTDLSNTEDNKKEQTDASLRVPPLSPDGDKLRSHPSIQAIKQITGYYPRRNLYTRIIQVVGDYPDLDKMKLAYDTWTANGNNPMNIKGWLFDWYKEEMYYIPAAQKF